MVFESKPSSLKHVNQPTYQLSNTICTAAYSVKSWKKK